MENPGTACFGIARSVAIAAVLLFTPITASASGADTHTLPPANHAVRGDHRVNVLADTLEQHDSPADQPLHCHLKSLHQQAIGQVPATVDSDLPLLMLQEISAPALVTEMHLPAVWAHIPILAPPRFILFGNFRS